MALSLHQKATSHFPPTIRSIWVSIAVGSIGFIGIFLCVHYNVLIATLDLPVHDWFFSQRNAILTPIMLFITDLLSPTTFAVIVLLGAGGWALYKKELWRPLLLIGAMALTMIVSTGIKMLAHRVRPPVDQMVIPHELDFSFPSGHTIGVAVALFVVAYLIYSRARVHLFAWTFVITVSVLLIAITRLYLGYHWLTDVSASVFLAFIILGTVMAIDRLKPARFS